MAPTIVLDKDVEGKMTEEKEYNTWKDFADEVSSFVE